MCALSKHSALAVSSKTCLSPAGQSNPHLCECHVGTAWPTLPPAPSPGHLSSQHKYTRGYMDFVHTSDNNVDRAANVWDESRCTAFCYLGKLCMDTHMVPPNFVLRLSFVCSQQAALCALPLQFQ